MIRRMGRIGRTMCVPHMPLASASAANACNKQIGNTHSFKSREQWGAGSLHPTLSFSLSFLNTRQGHIREEIDWSCSSSSDTTTRWGEELRPEKCVAASNGYRWRRSRQQVSSLGLQENNITHSCHFILSFPSSSSSSPFSLCVYYMYVVRWLFYTSCSKPVGMAKITREMAANRHWYLHWVTAFCYFVLRKRYSCEQVLTSCVYVCSWLWISS